MSRIINFRDVEDRALIPSEFTTRRGGGESFNTLEDEILYNESSVNKVT
jgi:hypothetical protein